MPKRTREHELEDESRTAFEAILPSAWVVRSVEKDYGIDCEVEVFVDGDPTGLTFKVQLKSTDTLHGRPPYRSIKLSHLEYWATLDVPVLIALYVAEERRLYVKWSFAHDPGVQGYSKKTTTVHFSAEDDLLELRSKRFVAELPLYRLLAAGHMEIPVPIDVSAIGDTPTAKYEFQQVFRESLQAYGLKDVVRITNASVEPALRLDSKPTQITLSMPLNAGSMSFHPKPRERFNFSREETVDTTLMLIASMMATRERTREALLICTAVGPSEAWFLPEVAARFCRIFESERRYDIALGVAKHLLDKAEDAFDLKLGSLYTEPARSYIEDMDEDEFDNYWDLLDSFVKAFEDRGDDDGSVSMLLNAASACSSRGRYSEAVSRLQGAIQILPAIVDAPKFANVLAANDFRAGQPALAAEMYAHDVAAGLRSPSLLSHYADALFSSGSYKVALEVINGKYGEVLTDRLSVVNGLASREIIEVTGVDAQQPRELTDQEIEAVEQDPSIAIDLLRDANALLYMLWFQLEPEPENWTLGRCCVLARLNLTSPELWLNATLRALEN